MIIEWEKKKGLGRIKMKDDLGWREGKVKQTVDTVKMGVKSAESDEQSTGRRDVAVWR